MEWFVIAIKVGLGLLVAYALWSILIMLFVIGGFFLFIWMMK